MNNPIITGSYSAYLLEPIMNDFSRAIMLGVGLSLTFATVNGVSTYFLKGETISEKASTLVSSRGA